MSVPLPTPPDPPRPPVAHASWQAAKRAVLAALADGETLVALTGPPGIGKSRLLRELEQVLHAPARPVTRLDDGALLDPAALPPLLLVDEAERLSDAALLGLARRGAGLAVLAALPGFGARLAGLPHRAVALAPLRPQDVPGYLAARMAEAGLDGRRLGEGTAAALAEAAQGIPARLNLLAGTSFLAADIAGAAAVAPAHVREAVAMQAELAAGPAGHAAEPPAEPPAEPLAEPLAEPAMEPSGGPGANLSQPAPPDPLLPHPLVPLPGTALAVLPPASPPRRLPPWALAAAALLLAGGLGWLALPGAAPTAGPAPSATASQAAPPPAFPSTAGGTTAPLPAAAALALVDNPVAGTAGSGATGAEITGAEIGGAELPAGDRPGANILAGEVPATGNAPGETPMPGAPPALLPDALPPGALPPLALPRVVVTYPRGTDTAAATALTAGLAEAGWTAGAPFPVARAAATPELRYFFREDRAAALAVQALGLAPLGLATAQLEPVAGGLPRPGAIEAALPAAPGTPAGPAVPPDTAAPAPAAATLLAPAEAATLAQRAPTLSWTTGPGATADFVEVLALDADGTVREVFAAYAATAGQQPLRLDGPGRYAWRVLAVSAPAQRYTPSPWRIFTLTEAPP